MGRDLTDTVRTRIPDLDHANVGSNCEKIEKWKYVGISTFFIYLRRYIGGTTLHRLTKVIDA